jgi:hypothetical protein
MSKLLRLLLIIILCFTDITINPEIVHAAVTVDVINNGSEGTEPLSTSVTVNSGATLHVWMCITDSPTAYIDSVSRSTDTYTEHASGRILDADGETANVWYKFNPIVGTNNISAATSLASTEGTKCWGMSVFGSVTSGDPFRGVSCMTNGSTTSLSTSVTAQSGDITMSIIGTGSTQTGFTTGGASETKTMDFPGGGGGHSGAGSYRTDGSGSISWTWTSGSSARALCVVSIKAAAVAAFGPLRRRFQ